MQRTEHFAFAICAAITLASALFAFAFASSPADLIPALAIMLPWSAAIVIIAMAAGFGAVVAAREERPIKALAALAFRRRGAIASAFAIMLLAGLNLVAFMWIKPLLNQLVPFWADPLLANIDRALFLGRDPWTVLVWINVPNAGFLYHPIWFLTIALALTATAFAAPGAEKSAVLTTYFLLWSVAAPLVHSLLPAAGPIFYEQMGYSARFAGLPRHPETALVADYLWSFYQSGSYSAGNGISAMPSMHVTTSVWVVIAVRRFAKRALPLAYAAMLAIFVLSITLGWHYAVDGLVGTALAVGIHRLVLMGFEKLARGDTRAVIPPAIAAT